MSTGLDTRARTQPDMHIHTNHFFDCNYEPAQKHATTREKNLQAAEVIRKFTSYVKVETPDKLLHILIKCGYKVFG